MRFRRQVGLGYGAFWRGVILDCEFKNLSDLVAQSHKFFEKFDDGAEFKKSASEYKWVWPTGEELLFRHAKEVKDYDKFHGHEYPFLGWNELTKHPTSELYDKMMSTNRCSFIPEIHTPKQIKNGKCVLNDNGSFLYATPDGKPLPEIPLEVFSTTNPSGAGHNWVKKRFITGLKNGEIVRRKIKVFDPRTKEEIVIERTQVAIFGSYRENIYLSAAYIAELNILTEGNENLRRAWLLGDWNVTAGGALDDLWKNEVHVIPRFRIPANWFINRAFDWGSADPFSVGWFAEANGEECQFEDGSIFCPVAGSLIQIEEWYGTKEIGTNKGLRLSAPDIAKGIVEREKLMMSEGWIKTQPLPGPADNQINQKPQANVETIATQMSNEGICWTLSDKSSGTRVNGLQLIRDRLQASIKKERPGLYFMRNCKGSTETLSVLPRDTKKINDVDTKSEDHVYDMLRYEVLTPSNRVETGGSYF